MICGYVEGLPFTVYLNTVRFISLLHVGMLTDKISCLFQALIHGLNRHYYSIAINYRKNELEQKVSTHLQYC